MKTKFHRRLISIAAAASLLVLLVPPWVHTYDRNGNEGAHSRTPAGFAPFFEPPATAYVSGYGRPEWHGVEIDSTRLVIELLGINIVTLAIYFVRELRRREESAALPPITWKVN